MANTSLQAPPMLFMFLYFLLLNSQPGRANEETELLLSFKSSIHDPLCSLSNWNSSATTCKWQGITCNNNNDSFHVKAIDLSGKNISGKISSSSIFHLPFIEIINLSSNQLSGEIPQYGFSSSSLRYLNLSNNYFTGPIPAGSTPTLESLDLSNNMLSGKIPPGIGSFSSLKFLDLGGNILVGEIPVSITNLTSLQFFTLDSNHLVGPIPPGIGQMRSLKWVYLGYNNLSGEIPNEIGELPALNHLDVVYNNLSGPIPSSLGNLTHLEYLFLYQNMLTGPIPASIFSLTKLISLDLSDNSLSGEIPELVIQLQNLEILNLFSNNFAGKIPRALASLPRLQVLQFWTNKFSGEIPQDLGRKNNLTLLDLSSNSLAGKIPEGLCNTGNLFKLILFSNSLEGEIPESLGTCKSLRRVRLQDNKISGKLSPEFTKLPFVYFLDISGNKLSGRVDDRKWEMPSLKMLNLGRNRFSGNLPSSFGTDILENLDLSGNQFSGSIPSKYGSLSELMQLKLSENKLKGEIPEELSLCKKLVSLDLSHNQLKGPIPSSFSEMPVLGQLDLSENQLSGEIPKDLGKVESLVQVNVSHNHLHGSLPFTGAFLVINASAVAGNNLCGGDTGSGLPPCKRAKTTFWWVVVAFVLGALVLLGLVTFGVFHVKERNSIMEKKIVENEGAIWELQVFNSKVSKWITIEDIFSSLEEGNVLSRGKKGNCYYYKGKSNVNDSPFVVKEINRSIPPNFWSEVAKFGKLQHPNIVKLYGTCRSNKRAYLVYEYIEGKKLSEVLRNLSWESRRKIARAIAKALWFWHLNCPPGVLIGCVSPRKVIIDGNGEPRLRLSLPGWLCIDKSTVAMYSLSPAYVAPETRETKRFTKASDMYGFGLLLIELLTGKSPADGEFGVHESVVEWARYCYSDCHLDTWIDPIIRRHVLINQNEILETMNLALHCTATDPTARPCAKHVSKALGSDLRTTSCFSVQKFSTAF